MKNFGSRLYNLIKHNDLTQKDFAAKISITEQALTNYLNNRLPKADVLIKIQQTFNASIDWLLTGKGEMLRTEGSAGPPSANQAEILDLLRWKVERLEDENKKLKGEVSSLKRELDQSPPGIRKSELKK